MSFSSHLPLSVPLPGVMDSPLEALTSQADNSDDVLIRQMQLGWLLDVSVAITECLV